MTREQIKAIFKLWQQEFIDDPCTPQELFESIQSETYADDATEHFIELSNQVSE